MTSTAVPEIIDLTETLPSSDNEPQKIPITEDCSTDPDPEKRKSATRAARKRKNGEAQRARSHPVKSRDGSLERGHAQPDEGNELPLAEDAQGSNGEPKGKKKRRSKKNKDKDNMDPVPSSREDTQHDALLTFDNGELFLVDTVPAEVPEDMAFDLARDTKPAPSSSQPSEPDRVPLLLPAHVSVLDPGDDLLVKIIQPEESDSDSESYIEYLDYDDRLAPDMVRYFQASAEEQKQTRFVCKRCGAESEHRSNECPVQICLTCGARDEHSTRSCPISKICFTCGMKGHINKSCPNRHSRGRVNNFDDCDRCGSDRHNTNECPTIWRLYEYVTDSERGAILQLRESKQPLALGQGGEGYIANDEWCHNCGNSGHLGDDCQELPRPHDTPSAPSAFGLRNILSGPFSDAAPPPVHARPPRDWENGETFGDGWGAKAPINIGKRARNRDRERMEQRALELQEQEQDDPGDWFANPRNMRNRGVRGPRQDNGERGPDAGGHGAGKKKDAKIRIGRAWKSDDPPPSSKSSLLDRVSTDDYDPHSRGGHRHYGRDRDRDRVRDGERDRDRGPERDRDRGGGWDRVRDRDRGRDRGRDDGADGPGLRIRGSASRFDSSRHDDSEVGERRGRRREESRTDYEYESRTSRDWGTRGPQYKGGCMR